MKLYLVTGTTHHDFGANGDVITTKNIKWVGTQADAAAEKKRLKGLNSQDIDVKDIDVPTDKQGLLRFLNEGKTS